MKLILIALFSLTGLSLAVTGIFESATDVGKIDLQGSSEYLADKATYRITGSGKNIWFAEDACQFLSKKVSGDLTFSMDVAWEAEGKEPHRKACAMVRQTLDADSPYVDVAVHGDGLIEMQYRTEKGATTLAARTPIQAPANVKLERDGDVFTVSVSKNGGPFQPVGAVLLAMPDPVYAGLAVGAHNAANLETALISNVVLKSNIAVEGAKRVRETSLETLDIATSERKIVYRDRSRFEAPNWSRDGKLFYFNRAGGIWTVPVTGGEPTQINTGVAVNNNNDHGLSFDGKWLAISSGAGEGGSKIYVVPATGGEAREITPTGPSYWHGWSPDGNTLAFCAKRNGNFDVYTIPTAGGAETRLTDAEGLDDGPEYTADGSKIYFHSERVGGVAKIFRMNPDGTAQEQVTFDEQYADWFPHPSPDGKWIVFVSFDKSVKGHPLNQNVVLRLMPMAGGKTKVIATLFGGQGTLNVPSWSPDSTAIALVSYRHILPPAGTASASSAPSDPWREKPNVLLIISDDLRDTVGCYGHPLAKTPNIDRLAARGVRFDRAFAQYPVCNPSRTSLLTGLRCEQTGVVGNTTFFRDALPDIVTLPQLLRQGGWTTHSFGKIYHTANTGEGQRTDWLDAGKSWDKAEASAPTAESREGDVRNLTGGKLPWCEVGAMDGPEENQPDAQTAAAAIRSLEELSASGKPWMVAAGFHRPHDPFHSPRKYFDLYPKDSLTLYRDPEDMTAAPPLAIASPWKKNFDEFSDDDRRSFMQAYLAGVSFMDAQVGRLLDALARLKLADNTIIIFLGDHGYHLGERGWWNKSTLFDRACRAPLLIAAPGIRGGQVCRSPVEFVDIYPTVAELCGQKPPHALAGKSLRPVLEDATREHKEAAFTLVTRGPKNFGQSVRTARWRYTRWSDGTMELYDHDADPQETHDVSTAPENTATIAELKTRLATLPPWPKK